MYMLNMHVLVNECKEKWRNLRTTFVRRMKESKSGSKAKKPYYLNEAMQFTIPFVKTCAIPSGNLSPIPNEDFEIADVWENSNISEYPEPNQQDSNPVSSPDMIISLSSNHPSTSNSTTPLITKQSENERVNTPESTFFKSKYTPGKKVKKNKNYNSSSTDADKAFTEYFEAKKAKLVDSTSDARTDSVKQFLNSLIPDLLTMSDAQLRTYKRRSIELIDTILCPPPVNSHSSASNYLSSFTSDESSDTSNYTIL